MGAEHVTKAACEFIIFTSTWLWNIVKSFLLKFVLSFPPENVSEDDPSESEKMLVMGLMQKQELSKAILPLAVNLSLGLYAMRSREDDEVQFVEQLIVAANMMGFALICNAILVPECTPTFARYAELLGVGLVISSFFLLLAIPLMWWLRIILALCWVFCIRPFIMAGVFANMNMMVAKTSTILDAGATEGVII